MPFKQNFVSVITIGNFNPGILRPEFLEKDCKIMIDAKPEGATTPVASEISYGNIKFRVDLERFQIVENDVPDFRKTRIVKFMDSYLRILPYTPTFVCGLNLNMTFSNVDEENLASYFIKQKREMLKKLLGRDELVISTKLRYTSEKKQSYLGWNVAFSGKPEDICFGQLDIKKQGNDFVYNFNCEVRDLAKDKSALKIFIASYPKIVKKHEMIIKDLFKEKA